MKNTIKVLSWIEVVLGTLALIDWVDSGDSATFLGGVLFLACGWLTLSFINKQ